MEYVIAVRGAVQELGDAARRLEALGYHGVGLGDHRGNIDRPHVWPGLAAIAAATTRAVVVSSFANNLFRHPAEFAQAARSLHGLAGGRFEAGLGAGWAAEELAAVGAALPSPRERVERLMEACEIAAPLLRGDGCDVQGRYYRAVFPATATPGPKLVAAVGGPVSCRRVAPLVDRVEVLYGPAVSGGSLDFGTWARLSVEELARRIDIVRAAAPETPVGVGVFAAAGDGHDVRHLQELAGAGLQRDLVGAPGQVAAAIHGLGSLGIDRVGITPLTADTAELLAGELFV